MKYNFDEIVNRYHTNSCKYDVLDNEIPFSLADMDFHVLPEIKATIKACCEVDAFGYAFANESYFESYVSWWKENHGLELHTNWMIFSRGVVSSIDSTFKALGHNGDAVVMLTPIYNVFFNCIKNNNLKLLACDFLLKKDKFEIDWDKLETLLKRKETKFLLLCNPHNPIGRLFSKEELTHIITLACENNVLVLSDEIHCDITDPSKSYVPSLEACPKACDNIITFLAPTKAFNIAGIQSSIIVVPNPTLYKVLTDAISKDDHGDPNTFAVAATIAAFKHGKEWNKEMREYIYQNKIYLTNFINKELPFLKLYNHEATYLMWLDVSNISSSSEAFAKQLRKVTGIVVSPGNIFGENKHQFIRINIATSLANIKEFCKRLQTFVKKDDKKFS
jgi:cysteine-S-conjugate beta-lyase